MVPRNDPYPSSSRRPHLHREPSQGKTSLFSPTPSAEGDDEHSSGDNMSYNVDFGEEDALDAPFYVGEDIRPTSRKELAGWYSYGWAAEVFAICAMSSFLPITLEQLARDQGVLRSDKTTPCSTSWESSSHAGSASKPKHKELPACVIHLLGAEINTASFVMYTFSISVLVQALLIISMSGAADHGRFRKIFLLLFAFTGATATMLFLALVPKLYLLGALLAIISNTCFGASFVLLNSFLPLIVRHHSSMQAEHSTRSGMGAQDEAARTEQSSDDESEASFLSTDSAQRLLLNGDPDPTEPTRLLPTTSSTALQLATRISSNGIGIGYIAGLLVQCAGIGIVVGVGNTTFSLRLVLFVVGLWWFVFSIPAALWLRPRPGPPLPMDSTSHQNWVAYTIYAWRSLWKTVKKARRLKDIVIFLGAWFLLSDSIATVSGTAVLFAKTSLGMKPYALGLINVIATIAGVIGAFYWSTFSRAFNLRPSQTIVACICLFEIIPIYGLLGFIPAVRRYGTFGLQQPWEMYPLGALYGFVLGGLSSYCRAFFGELIPPGFEAAFYALYAITDKGSSIFGPAVVGAITDRYGEIRPAFVFLTVLIFLPLPLMLLVDSERGRADAVAMAVELEGDKHGSSSSVVPTPRLSNDEA